jgi:predicted RNA-binding Zn-ribbon protein involved in translation (DUF1610 family)
MIKVCESCGVEFSDRPVFHTCPECREKFQRKMDKRIKGWLGAKCSD